MQRDLFGIGVPFLAGAVVSLLVVYGAGLMTTTGTARADVALARIDERATMCQEAAVTYLAGQALPSEREASNALAKQFVVITGDKTKDRMVLEACTLKLSA